MVQIALFQPEIAQNVGTLLRFGACMGTPIHIIEPCGFLMTDQKLRRAGMDYSDLACMHRYISWNEFLINRPDGRLIATSPVASKSYTNFEFASNDILLMGQESIGLPEEILLTFEHTVSIPMIDGRRSLNLALSAGIITSEALRQINMLPQQGALNA